MANSQTDIVADLAVNPCQSNQCLGQREQLIQLVAQLNQILDQRSPAFLENATKQFRNMGKPLLVQYLLTAFPEASPAVNCFECYSDQKLTEMLYWLLWKLVNAHI